MMKKLSAFFHLSSFRTAASRDQPISLILSYIYLNYWKAKIIDGSFSYCKILERIERLCN